MSPTRKDRLMTNTSTNGSVCLPTEPSEEWQCNIVNLHRRQNGVLNFVCFQTSDPASLDVTDAVSQWEDAARQHGEIWFVRFRVAAAFPAARAIVSDLAGALNARSLPLRRGRWLSEWPFGDCPYGHAVVFWGQDGKPLLSQVSDLLCTCGLPVTVTATDVFCVSGHTIDAAV